MIGVAQTICLLLTGLALLNPDGIPQKSCGQFWRGGEGIITLIVSNPGNYLTLLTVFSYSGRKPSYTVAHVDVSYANESPSRNFFISKWIQQLIWNALHNKALPVRCVNQTYTIISAS